MTPPSVERAETVLDSEIGAVGVRSLFSSAAWLQVISETYGFDCQALRVGRSALLFALVDDLRQQRLISFPFSDYCDPFLASPGDWPLLLDELVGVEVPIHLRLLHTPAPDDARFRSEAAGLWHSADLTRGPDEMWAEFPSAARQNVRRAERDDITVRLGTTMADVELFHRMHRSLRRRRYELLAQPRRFFEVLYKTFIATDDGFVLIAEHDGEPVAGLFLIQSGDTLYYKFNASTDRGSRPNDLLAWRAMQEGHDRGLETLDFGFSDLDQPGLHRFKRKFADREETIVEVTHTPTGWDAGPALAAGELLGSLTRLFVDPIVPDALSARAGDALYRYFC